MILPQEDLFSKQHLCSSHCSFKERGQADLCEWFLTYSIY